MPNWKKGLYAVSIAELLAITGFSTSVPIIPFYLGDLGIHDPTALKAWVGVAQSMAGITLVVFQPIWGRLGDLYGRRLMLLRAMFGGFVVMGLMGFARQPWQLVVLRAMQGVFTGTVGAATTLVASIIPAAEAGFGLGLLQSGVFVGASLGPFLGGALSDALGNRAPFWTTSLLLLTAALIVLTMVREEPRPPERARSTRRRLLPDPGMFRQSRGLLGLLVTVATLQIANNVTVPIIPMFIQSLVPGSTAVGSTTGLILGISALASAVASAVVGKLSYRVGYRRALVLCILGAGLLSLPQALVRTPFQLLLLRVGGALFLGGTAPTVNASIAAATDRAHQGAVYGLSASIASSGLALGPLIGAVVGMGFGFPAVFLTAGLILLAGGLFVARRGTGPAA